MKQSSIEWLISFIEPSLTPEQKHFFSMVIERAKAMHKDEIEDAYTSTSMSNAKEYYNETFNTKECYHKGKYTYNKETFECHKCGLIVPNEYRFNTKEK